MKIRKSIGFIPILLFMLLTGCGGLPNDIIKEAKKIPNTIKLVNVTIESNENAFQELQKSGDWSFLKVYAEREKWAESFASAKVEILHAEEIFNSKITPLLKRNESEELGSLHIHMKKLQNTLNSARLKAESITRRKEFLFNAKTDAPEWVKVAKHEISEIDKLLSIAKEFSEKAKVDYSAKATDIAGRLAALNKLGSDAHDALIVSQNELAKVSSGNADYAKLGDSTTFVSKKLKELNKLQSSLKKKLDELYRSYSKTLIDMRIEYWVIISRASWDSWSDWDNSPDYSYTRQVDEKVFTTLESVDTTIATHSGASIAKNIWNSLKINMKESWCCGDDRSEFWVENAFTKTYHKYLIVENGEKKDTDWQEVNEDSYWKQEENLGLTIISKPYGMYEEETLKTAAPPGMEYVVKPTVIDGQATGKNQYGEWKQDNSGNSFWHYYGQYAMINSLLGSNNRYHYDDYYSYSRRDRNSNYYGRNEGYGTYGHRTYSNAKYSSSSYAKSNKGTVKVARASRSKTGGISTSSRGNGKTQTASVRGSGSKSRGRGPSGGGK